MACSTSFRSARPAKRPATESSATHVLLTERLAPGIGRSAQRGADRRISGGAGAGYAPRYGPRCRRNQEDPMLLVDKLNKGKLPEKPDKGESAPVPGLSSLVVKPQNVAARIPNVDAIKRTIHERLIAALGQNSDAVSSDVIQRRIEQLTDEYCDEAKLKLTKYDRAELAELILHDVLGLGPLESLLEDPEVSEIMVNGPKTIFTERRGRIGQSDLVFENERELRKVIDRIVARIGRRVDESSPMVDARLPDGSRVNIVIPPLAVQGSSITIRKFSRAPYKVQDLVTSGTLTQDRASFILAFVRSRITLVSTGVTASASTTTLNVLSNFIPDTERVVTA